MKGQLREGSVASKIRRFFDASPDEELDYEAVKAKFECTDSAARCAVMKLKKRGLVEAVHIIRRKDRA